MIFMCMNRELRRVPLDFDWPLNKVWLGYHLVPYNYRENRKHDESRWTEYIHEKIRSVEPPTGEGYQCWETVSEGSPISPVFKSFEELCDWLEHNPRGITNRMKKEDWMMALRDNAGLINISNNEFVSSDKTEAKR